MSEKGKDESPRPRKSQPHVLEWVLGAVSALAILALMTFLIIEGFIRMDGQPLLSLREVRLLEQPGGTGVVVEVHNGGNATAATVAVRGTTPDRSSAHDVTLDYAPAQSTREVTLVFPGTVTSGTVDLKVLGYQVP